jgi:ribosomal protein S7
MEQKKQNHIIKKLFINLLMKKGKKNNSEIIFFNILKLLKIKTKQKPIFILNKSILNLIVKIKLIDIKYSRKKKFFLHFLKFKNQIKISIISLLKNKNNFINLNLLTNEIINIYQKKSKLIEQRKIYYKKIKTLKYNLVF